jgi:hypothetical protein
MDGGRFLAILEALVKMYAGDMGLLRSTLYSDMVAGVAMWSVSKVAKASTDGGVQWVTRRLI